MTSTAKTNQEIWNDIEVKRENNVRRKKKEKTNENYVYLKYGNLPSSF